MAKYCIKCGTDMPDNEVKCPKCGMKAAKIRDTQQIKKLRKKVIIITSVLVLLIAIITISVIAFVNSTYELSDIFKGLRGKTIVTVDGYKIPENEFRFFCALVLEDQNLVYYYKDSADFDDIIKQEALQFVKEYVCRLKEAKSKGFKLTEKEKKEVLKQVDNDYIEYSKGLKDIKNEKEFYEYFYGISKKQFIEFRYNWKIIDKYNASQEANADTSEKMQETAYEAYKDFLYSKDAMIVVRSLVDLDDDEIDKEKEKVQKLYEDIVNGDDMFAIVKGYGQDESVLENKGIVTINASYESTYPELYEWFKDAELNDLDIVKSDTALYIVRCEKISDFSALKDTENMISWTKTYIVNKNIEDLMKSDKYKIDLSEKNYKNLDISDMTKETLDYLNQAWAG